MIHLLYNLLLPSVKKKADLRGPTPTSSIPNTPRLPGISQLDTGRGNSRRWPFACRSLAPHQKSTHCCMLSYSDLVTSAATKIHVTFWVFVFSTLLYFNCNVLWFFFNIHMIVCVAMPFIDSWNILLLFLICLSENNYKHVLFEHNLR